MSKVLVTGGSGFIGSHIAQTLFEKDNYDVWVLDINMRTDWTQEQLRRFSYIHCDITDQKSLEYAFSRVKPEYVIHCAARTRIQASFKNPVETYETNVLGTLNLLEFSRRFGVKKFVYSASSSAYGPKKKMPLRETTRSNPLNPYADSKLMGEMLVKRYAEDFGLKGCSLRYFNVYGPRQKADDEYATVIVKFLSQLKNNKPFSIVPDGYQRRDFTWVGDVVRANILAMESEKAGKGEVINIGGGKNYSIFELAVIIGGKDYPTVFLPPRKGEIRESLADVSKAKRLFDWEPRVSLEEGIEIFKND